MKKIFLYVFFVFSLTLCFGQNPDINIKYLHSAGGKQWKIKVRPDGYQFPASMEDDVFIFYSNNQFKYEQSGTVTEKFLNARTSAWSYNTRNNTVTMEFYLPNGSVSRMEAEVTFIDENRAVMNLSEDRKEPNIVVFVSE